MESRPSLDQIFGASAPVPLYQPANENDRNTAISNVFQPQRPSLDEIFGNQPKKPPMPSVGEDVMKSVGSNLAQGALSVPFGFGNLGNQLVAGPQLLGRGIAEGVDQLAGIQPQPRGNLWQPFYDAGNATHDLGIDYQPKTAWGAAASIPAQVAGSLGAAKGIEVGFPKMMNTQENNSSGIMRNNQGEPSTAQPIPTSQQMRDVSSNQFNTVGQAQSALMPNASNTFADKANTLTPQTPGAQIVFGKPSAAEETATNIQGLRDRPLTIQETQEIDSRLGQLAEDHFDKVKGDYDSEGQKYLQLQHHLRDTWQNAGPNDVVGGKDAYNQVTQARDLWAAQSRMADIERLEKRASFSDNPQTIIKNGAKRLAMNPHGYTDEEIDALNTASKTGILGGALKSMNNKYVDAIIGGLTGSATGIGPVAGAVIGGGVSKVANIAGNKLQAGKLANVKQAIANRPVVQNAFKP